MRKKIPRKFIIICDGCGVEAESVKDGFLVLADKPSWYVVRLFEMEMLGTDGHTLSVQHEFCPKCADILRTTLKAILPAKVEAAPDA